MTHWRNRYTTQALLILTTACLIAWDIYAEATSGEGGGATISEVTLHFFWLHPPVAFALGGIFGHLTWPTPTIRPLLQRMALVIGALAAILVADLLHIVPHMMPLYPFAIGMPAGHFLWSQSVNTEKGIGL